MNTSVGSIQMPTPKWMIGCGPLLSVYQLELVALKRALKVQKFSQVQAHPLHIACAFIWLEAYFIHSYFWLGWALSM
jgi:hypothetical protein